MFRTFHQLPGSPWRHLSNKEHSVQGLWPPESNFPGSLTLIEGVRLGNKDFQKHGDLPKAMQQQNKRFQQLLHCTTAKMMGSREEKTVHGNSATLLLNFSMPYCEKVQRWSEHGVAQLFHLLSKNAQSSDRAPSHVFSHPKQSSSAPSSAQKRLQTMAANYSFSSVFAGPLKAKRSRSDNALWKEAATRAPLTEVLLRASHTITWCGSLRSEVACQSRFVKKLRAILIPKAPICSLEVGFLPAQV